MDMVETSEIGGLDDERVLPAAVALLGGDAGAFRKMDCLSSYG